MTTLFEIKKQIKTLEEMLNAASAAYQLAKADNEEFKSGLESKGQRELADIARERKVLINGKLASKNNKKGELVSAIAEVIENRYDETKAEYERLQQQLEALKVEYEQEYQAEQERKYEQESEQDANSEHWETIDSLVARPLDNSYKLHFKANGDIDIYTYEGIKIDTKSTRPAAMRAIGTHAGRATLPDNIKLSHEGDGRWYLTVFNPETGVYEKVKTEHKHHSEFGGYISWSRFSRAHTGAIAYADKQLLAEHDKLEKGK